MKNKRPQHIYVCSATHRWEAEGVVRGHSDDCAVLDTGSTADRDFVHVAADHCAVPVRGNQHTETMRMVTTWRRRKRKKKKKKKRIGMRSKILIVERIFLCAQSIDYRLSKIRLQQPVQILPTNPNQLHPKTWQARTTQRIWWQCSLHRQRWPMGPRMRRWR